MNAPRKVAERLDFIDAFEDLVRSWPADEKWPLTEISGRTKTKISLVVSYIMEISDKEIDIHDPLTYKEADKLLNIFKSRMRIEIEANQERLSRMRDRAIQAYDLAAEKVRIFQVEKNWYAAYKTLSYFCGEQEANLSPDTLLSICSECLRLGVKANVNLQELSQWMQKGIRLALAQGNIEAFEDALDFFDAYSGYFLTEPSGKGKRLISSILAHLNVSAADMGMTQKLNEIILGLNIPYDALQL